MNIQELRRQLRDRGFVVFRGLLSDDEIKFYRQRLEALSGISANGASQTGGDRPGRSWRLPDGIEREPDFWPLITDERLVSIIRNLLGPGVRYAQRSDLEVNFSTFAWHRDNVDQHFNQGPDWDEEEEPYRIVRVGFYLQSYAESNYRMGFIPRSHRPVRRVSRRRRLYEAHLKWLSTLSQAFISAQSWSRVAQWIAIEPGNCVIYDPRVLHTDSAISGPKLAMFLTYGVENRHFYNHVNYHHSHRQAEEQKDAVPELAALLHQAGLYP